jgi:hypothetical protein
MRKSLFVLVIVSLFLLSSFATFAAPIDPGDDCSANVEITVCETNGCVTEGSTKCVGVALKTCIWDAICGCDTWVITSSTCTDNNICTTDGCSAGACTHTNVADGQSCGTNLACQNGVCVATCAPNCVGKICGQLDSNCGTVCKTGCGSGNTCQLVNNVWTCVCTKTTCSTSNPSCCPGCQCSVYYDEVDYVKTTGRCLCDSPPPAPGPCAGGSPYAKASSDLPACDGNCADHLDYDSYRKEKDGPNQAYNNVMESSVGANTWRGACLARPGVTYSDEIPGTWYDVCTDASHLRVYYLDGYAGGVESLKSATFACPNNYACSQFGSGNDYCKYSCSSNADCVSGYYCSSSHCCAQGAEWDSSRSTCVSHDQCTTTCSLSNFWSDADCWKTLPLPYEQACCNVGYKYGYNAWYDFLAISIY